MKCPVRWQSPAKHPPGCRAPRPQPRRSGVPRHLSSLAWWFLRCKLRLVRQGMRHDHQAVHAAAWGEFIVVTRNKLRHRLDELVAEGGAIGRGPKPDLGVERHRREMLVSCP